LAENGAHRRFRPPRLARLPPRVVPPPPGCAWRQWAVPCSTVRFAETYSRKPEELSLLGFCSARRALCVAQLPPDALFLGSPFKGRLGAAAGEQTFVA